MAYLYLIALIFFVFCSGTILPWLLQSKLARLEGRVKELEQRLASTAENPVVAPPVDRIAAPVADAAPVEFSPKPSEVIEDACTPKEAVKSAPKGPSRGDRLWTSVKENWTGVLGSLLLVLGAAFFALTSELMQRPAMRVAVLVVAGTALYVASRYLQSRVRWQLFGGWLRAVSGAVILLATLGAGVIDGLRFIESPGLLILLLSLGITYNLVLSLGSRIELVACLHVLLSFVALGMVPQSLYTLPIGVSISLVGIIGAYRLRWNRQLLLPQVAYAGLNLLWLSRYHSAPSTSAQLVAMLSAATVAGVGLLLPFVTRRHFGRVSLLVYGCTWGLLVTNLLLHCDSQLSPALIFGGLSVVGCVLSVVARRLHIHALYHANLLMSQVAVLGMLATLQLFQLDGIDKALLAYVQTLAFSLLVVQKPDDWIQKLARGLVAITFVVFGATLLESLLTVSAKQLYPVYARLCVATIASWLFHGRAVHRSPAAVSAPLLLGATCLVLIGLSGHSLLWVKLSMPAFVLSIAWWRRRKGSDPSWDLSFLLVFVGVHIPTLLRCLDQLGGGSYIALTKQIDSMGLLLIDFALVLSYSFKLPGLRTRLQGLALGFLCGLLALLSYLEGSHHGTFIPGLAYLLYSLLFLELGRQIPRRWAPSSHDHQSLRRGLTLVGASFIALFLGCHLLWNLQIESAPGAIPWRQVISAGAVGVLAYWIVALPRVPKLDRLRDALYDVTLAFLTLTVFVEASNPLRPVMWSLLSIGLLIAVTRRLAPLRLALYSWGYLLASVIHTAFVTRTVYGQEGQHVAMLLTIVLQGIYLAMSYKYREPLCQNYSSEPSSWLTKAQRAVWSHVDLSVLLPVFAGIALHLAFNFSATLLTLLWVGLILVYFSAGLLLRSAVTVQIAMASLLVSCTRLVFYDLNNSSMGARALVFTGVGIFMLIISMLYKRFKERVSVEF